MSETLTLQPALRPINLVPLEEQEVSLQNTLLEQQQSAEATAEQTTFLRKAGALAMKAVGLVENRITKAAIYTQIKTWDAIETVTGAVEHVSTYMKQETGSKLAHGCLAVLALGGSAGFMELEDSGTAYAAATNTISYTINPNTAAGGVFARFGPNSNDTTRTPGYGVYPNDTVDLLCGVTDGTAVGPYNNTTWHYVHDKNNPAEGNFWVNDHYVNSPNAPSKLAPGESTCVDEGSNPMAIVSAPAPSQPASPGTLNYAGACEGSIGASLLGSAQGGYDDVDGSQAWSQETVNNPNADICVGALMGEPNSADHTQYIGQIESSAPDLDPSGCSTAYEVEVWGQGFYKETDCINPTSWNIDKTLPNGTYVCAALSSAYDTGYYKDDADAAQAVRSGKVQLGSADPYREITCFEVKA